MKEKIKEICNELNQKRISVFQATELIMELINKEKQGADIWKQTDAEKYDDFKNGTSFGMK